MSKASAGLLPYRRRGCTLEVFLVHPGGPFWAGKDRHAWSIAKGELGPGEEPLQAALREFREETGLDVAGPFFALTPRRQPGGKLVHAFACAAELRADAVRSNSFEMEWPPRSQRMQRFPEVDRAAWFELATARQKLHKGQVAIVDELAARLGTPP